VSDSAIDLIAGAGADIGTGVAQAAGVRWTHLGRPGTTDELPVAVLERRG